MPGSDYRLCKFGMIVFNCRYVQQWLYIQDKQVLHVLSNATPTMMFPWNWQIWWQHDPSSRTQGLGLQFCVTKKKTAGNHAQCFGSNGTKLSKCRSNVLLLSGFMKAGIFAAQCCLLEEVLLILPDSALLNDLWVVQLWTMIGRVITCSVASLPSKTQQEFMEQFLFYLAWQLLCSLTQAWAPHQLYFGASRWGRKLLSELLFFFVRLNFLGHSESLKRPQFLRANHASVDILYCLSVI